MIVNGKELEHHINCYCEENECDYIFDKVEYCEQNRLDRMQVFSKSAKERFLYKNKDLAYQREYRLVIAHEMPIDHFVRIGKLDNSGNINIILRKIDAKKYKHGAALLGISSSRAIDALGDTRNELTHYIYKSGSLGSFINNPDTETDNMVNLYAFYVLEIALRIAVLEVIGVNVSDDVKNYVMDEHLDWIKLEKHLDEDCVLPMNVFRQMIEKLQNQEQKP